MYRLIFAPIYNAIIGAFHKAFSDIGAIPPDASGTQAEQVRAVLRGEQEVIEDAAPDPARKKRGQ